MRKILFELLQVAVGTRKELSGSLSVDEWNGLFKVLKKQSLFGVGFDAICQLPAEQRPPKPLLLQGYALAEFIKEQNAIVGKRNLARHRNSATTNERWG